MGNPAHFSLELPHRCLTLIDELWDHASSIHGGQTPDLGPLTTTFLLSMSMPMINLPLERIERHIKKGAQHGYVDDREINQEAVKAFEDYIQNGRLGDAPFFNQGVWSFVKLGGELPNLARGLPDDTATDLAKPSAFTDAAKMDARQWISILRNALAHGGILYLNKDGRSFYGEATKMLAFVSGKTATVKCPNAAGEPCGGRRGEITHLNILRISEADYHDFLHRWVDWLGESGVSPSSKKTPDHAPSPQDGA